EFPGQGYTTGLLGAGAYPGTQATTDSGRTVQFIPSGGRTYVLSFVADNGQPMWSVIGTFALRRWEERRGLSAYTGSREVHSPLPLHRRPHRWGLDFDSRTQNFQSCTAGGCQYTRGRAT